MIDPSDIVKNVSEPFTSSLSDAWQWLLGDRIAAWRIQNAAKIQVKVNAELAALGLKSVPANIPERYAFAWFEEATKQDDEEIQTLFARLLAKAAAGDDDAQDRRLLEIVSRMVPGDAAVLNYAYAAYDEKDYLEGERYLGRDFKEWDLTAALEKNLGSESLRSFEHLITLGVFERDTYLADVEDFVEALRKELSGAPGWFRRPDLNTQSVTRLTLTGRALVRATSPTKQA